jgi:hypothetical protein
METEDDQNDIEYAEANYVEVLETIALHASDVLYWLDGTTGLVPAEMTRIDIRLAISFSAKPRAISVLHKIGQTAFWRRADTSLIDGEATQAQIARPAVVPFDVIGEAWDFSRRFNPVAFNVTLGAGTGAAMIVYPSPMGTKIPNGGVLLGTALVDATQEPVIWGMVEVTITIAVAETLTVRAQTDANGDFILPLKRLPPLPESVTEYSAQLTLQSNVANSADVAPDPSSYSSVQIESLTAANNFTNTLALTITPGERRRIRSSAKTYLAVA